MKTTTGRYDGPAAGAAAWFAGLLAVLLLVWPRAAAEARPAGQDDRQAQVDELARVLGMTAEEVEALGLSSAEVGVLLEGYTEETVVIGTRARPAAQARDGPFPGQHVSGKSRANPEATDMRETVVTRPWTDRLRAGAASIRAIHFLELRTRIAALRDRASLPPFTSVPHFQDHASDNWEPEGAGNDGVVNRSWSGRRSNMLSWSTCSIW